MFTLQRPLQSMTSIGRTSPFMSSVRSKKRSLSGPNILMKSLPVPQGKCVTATFESPAAPFTHSLSVPSPPQA